MTQNKPPTTLDTLFQQARDVAHQGYNLVPLELVHLINGRVNDTFQLKTTTGIFLLQRLSPVFMGSLALGLNWLTIQESIASRSKHPTAPLPHILPSTEGSYLYPGPQGDNWRLTTFINGVTPAKGPAEAQEAARLLGFFHSHLNQPKPLELLPLPMGESTNQYLPKPNDFETITDIYHDNTNLEELRPTLALATQAAQNLPLSPEFITAFQRRDLIIHGDPKIDNFMFNPETGQALALVDWDTAQLGNFLVDIAEMLRSWGTPQKSTSASLPQLKKIASHLLPPVVEGYAESGLELTAKDLELLPQILRAISLNLCRRYLTDALAQTYFRWDSQAYPSLYHQNRERALSLLAQSEEIRLNELKLTDAFKEAYQRGQKRK